MSKLEIHKLARWSLISSVWTVSILRAFSFSTLTLLSVAPLRNRVVDFSQSVVLFL